MSVKSRHAFFYFRRFFPHVICSRKFDDCLNVVKNMTKVISKTVLFSLPPLFLNWYDSIVTERTKGEGNGRYYFKDCGSDKEIQQ